MLFFLSFIDFLFLNLEKKEQKKKNRSLSCLSLKVIPNGNMKSKKKKIEKNDSNINYGTIRFNSDAFYMSALDFINELYALQCLIFTNDISNQNFI